MITIPPPAKRLQALVRLIPVAVLVVVVAAIRYQPAEVFPAAAILSHADDPQFWNYWQLVLGTYHGEGIVGASRVDYVQYQTERGCQAALETQPPPNSLTFLGRLMGERQSYFCMHIGDERHPLTNPGP